MDSARCVALAWCYGNNYNDPYNYSRIAIQEKINGKAVEWLGKVAYVKNLEPLVDEISLIAKEIDRTPAQIILNWLVSKDNVFAIFNTTKEDHLRENLGSLEWSLRDSDLKRLDEAVKKVVIDYFIR